MFDDRNTLRLIKEACHALWPGRHIAGPAEELGCSKAAVASWLSGRRHMPAEKMANLAASCVERTDLLRDLAGGIAYAAEQARTRGRRPRGFQVVKDWDGTGTMCDRRWRGGKGKRSN